MRDLITMQTIKVKHDSKLEEYKLFLSDNQSPFYLNSTNRNTVTTTWAGALILPISHREFYKNTSDYFYGEKIIVKIESKEESYLDSDDAVIRAIATVQISHDIRRIRFYPEHEVVIVDKVYAPLYPTENVGFSGSVDISNLLGQKYTLSLLYSLADFYRDRQV